MVPNGYTSKRPGPYWSNPAFFNFWHSGALVPECQKLKNAGLDQYGPERFGSLILLQSEKCGTERVNWEPGCMSAFRYPWSELYVSTELLPSRSHSVLPRRCAFESCICMAGWWLYKHGRPHHRNWKHYSPPCKSGGQGVKIYRRLHVIRM